MNSLIIKSKLTDKLKKNDIQNICKLKNSHWKYGIKSQLKWFQMNMKEKIFTI